jgi:DUF917 family protein
MTNGCAETPEPITTESLRYSLRVVVLGITCDPRCGTGACPKLIGPG